jgi:hypothetical protein
VALAYKGERKEEYAAFYEALQGALPCRVCAKHYAQEIERDPVRDSLDDGKALFDWTVRLHNAVNVRLNKRQWSTEEARAHYSRLVFSPSREDGEGSLNDGDFSKPISQSATCPSSARNAMYIALTIAVVTIIILLLLAVFRRNDGGDSGGSRNGGGGWRRQRRSAI